MNSEETDRYKKECVEFYTSIIAQSYEKAAAYTNLIIVAGYVLFFTFWNEIRKDLDYFWSSLSVIFMIISVIFFIAWEITQMINSSLYFKKLHETFKIAPDKYSSEIEGFYKKSNEFKARLASIWVWELVLTIIPGLIGLAILLFVFIQKLFTL